ncbi:MAG: hypothetical protein TECD_00099 [Hyphomicrobiaceae bacterium hypho_1]
MFFFCKIKNLAYLIKDSFFYFRSNRNGIASIEFAIILPLVTILFVSVIELSWAITVNRRVHQITNLTADLIARRANTTTSELDSIFNVHAILMKPYEVEPLELIATHVISDTSGSKVCWSHSNKEGLVAYEAGSPYTLPVGILGSNQGLVVVETEYLYQPILFSVLTETNIPFREKLFLAPRTSSKILLNDEQC